MGDDLLMMGVWRWGGCDDGRLLKGVFGRGFDDICDDVQCWCLAGYEDGYVVGLVRSL